MDCGSGGGAVRAIVRGIDSLTLAHAPALARALALAPALARTLIQQGGCQ